MTKIVVIGAVAAGTSAIAKARRNSEEVELIAYTSGGDISYSGCGIPYYVGEEYIRRENLTPRDAQWFESRFGMKMNLFHQVTAVDSAAKTIEVQNELTGEISVHGYDKLVVATGARPRKVDFERENLFYVRDIHDGDALKRFIAQTQPRTAVVVGSGYIGMEMIENLTHCGMEVTVVETAKSIGRVDPDLSKYIEKYLRKKGIRLLLSDAVERVSEDGKTVWTKGGAVLQSDLIVAAIGVSPNVEFLRSTGIALGAGGAIRVNRFLETSIADIYAVGDCATSFSRITGEETYVPLGSTANKMGRILGDRLTGGQLEFQGILGTSIFKVFDLAVASTGLSEKEARAKGFDVEVIHNIKPNQTEYFASSRELLIKAVADRATKKLLGVEIVGENGVDKRIDVFATLLTFGATVDQLFHLDLAYAPPFSTTKDPVSYTGMILENAIEGRAPIVTPSQLMANRSEYLVVDVRSAKQFADGHIDGAIHIPIPELRARAKTLDRSQKIVIHCNKGVTGNLGQNILLNLGFKAFNLSGGYKNYLLLIGR